MLASPAEEQLLLSLTTSPDTIAVIGPVTAVTTASAIPAVKLCCTTEVVTVVNQAEHGARTTSVGAYVVAEGHEGVELWLAQWDCDVLVDRSRELG